MAFKGDHETRTRISSQEAPAVSPWSLPKVTGEHVVAIERKKSLEKKSPLAQQSKVPDSALVTPPPPPPESVVSLAEAESIREAAYQEGLLQGLSEGREKGYPEGVELGKEEGKKLGYEEAFKQGQAELEQSMANLALIMQDLQSPIAQQEQAYAESIRSLVIKLSQAVIQAELKAQPDVILAAVNTALAAMPKNESGIELKVSPADFVHLKALQPMLDANVELTADGAVAPGGFELITPNTLVSSDMDADFQTLADQMLKYLVEGESENGAGHAD